MNAPNRNCPECGKELHCGSESPTGRCWCGELPRIMPVDPTTTCRCPDCLAKAIAKRIDLMLADASHGEALRLAAEHAQPGNPVEHIDYTFEDGLMVFTPWYLLKRGTCCGNRCRNCPFPD